MRVDANTILKDDYRRWTNDPGGIGWEIVKEIAVCGACKCASVENHDLRTVYGQLARQYDKLPTVPDLG